MRLQEELYVSEYDIKYIKVAGPRRGCAGAGETWLCHDKENNGVRRKHTKGPTWTCGTLWYDVRTAAAVEASTPSAAGVPCW